MTKQTISLKTINAANFLDLLNSVFAFAKDFDLTLSTNPYHGLSLGIHKSITLANKASREAVQNLEIPEGVEVDLQERVANIVAYSQEKLIATIIHCVNLGYTGILDYKSVAGEYKVSITMPSSNKAPVRPQDSVLSVTPIVTTPEVENPSESVTGGSMGVEQTTTQVNTEVKPAKRGKRGSKSKDSVEDSVENTTVQPDDSYNSSSSSSD